MPFELGDNHVISTVNSNIKIILLIITEKLVTVKLSNNSHKNFVTLLMILFVFKNLTVHHKLNGTVNQIKFSKLLFLINIIFLGFRKIFT
jgi:hypothetical protein